MVLETVETLAVEALSRIDGTDDRRELQNLRVHYLGKKGVITALLKQLGTLPAAERPQAGKLINEVKSRVEAALARREKHLGEAAADRRLEQEKLDISLSGRGRRVGALHPITLCLRKIEDFFSKLGFDTVEGPDIEDDFHNFEALNIPELHPARAMHDTFYLENGMLLRTHTSPVQIRTMRTRRPPMRIIAPGRVYRCDSDMTHSPMFHQVEGLVVEEAVSFSDLKGIVEAFLRDFFDDESLQTRFRHSYFPFTEPSAEVDIRHANSKWLEVMGCGIVHPRVLEAVDYEAERWSAYAFGLGVERLAMLLYEIDDLRLFFENDIRFIDQFRS